MSRYDLPSQHWSELANMRVGLIVVLGRELIGTPRIVASPKRRYLLPYHMIRKKTNDYEGDGAAYFVVCSIFSSSESSITPVQMRHSRC